MKKKIKSIILIFVIILLLLIGVAYAYIYTDFFKTEKQLFIKYFVKNINEIEEFNFEPYNMFFTENQNENSQIKVNVELTSTEESEQIEPITIDVSAAVDLKEKKQSIEVNAKQEENEMLALNLILSDDVLGLKVNGVHEKYLSLKNENLKEFFKKFDVDEETLEQIPDKINFFSEMSISNEDIEKTEMILKNHSQVFIDLLENGEYSSNKKVNIQINNETFTTNQYNFTITEKSAQKAILTFVNDLINDPEFVNLYLSDIDLETLTDAKEELVVAIEDTEYIDETSKITISVYENDGKTIKTDLKMEELEISYQLINKENNSNMIISVKENSNSETLYYPDSEVIVKISNSTNETSGQLTVELENKYDQEDIDKLNKQEKEEQEEYGYDYEVDYSEWYKDSSQKYIINSIKKDNKNIEATLSLNDLEDMEFNANVKINFAFGDTIKILELNEGNTLILNDYSKEDLENLGNELYGNIEKTAQENPMFILNSILLTDSVLERAEESSELTKVNIVKEEINISLTLCLADYLANYYSTNGEANINDYITIEKIRENCSNVIDELELIDANTLKVIYYDDVYYVKISIIENNGEYSVGDIEVFTEEEYQQ